MEISMCPLIIKFLITIELQVNYNLFKSELKVNVSQLKIN
jgi:hypothetical protein